MAKGTPLERIMAAVVIDETSGCWRCPIGVGGTGYSYVSMGSRSAGLQRSHRVVYSLFVGPIPEGLDLDHVRERGCIYRDCVNPEHLEPVTRRENLRRGNSRAAIAVRTGLCVHGHNDWVSNGPGRRTCRICRRVAELRRRS